MNRETCITHRPRQHVAIVRSDYFELMRRDCVAAALLSEFEYRANGVLLKQPTIENPWLGEITIKELQDALLGISTDKQIRTRLKTLQEKGYIETRQPLKHRKTLEYRLMITVLQHDLNAINAPYFLTPKANGQTTVDPKANGQTTVDPTVKQPLGSGQTTVDPTVKQPLHYIQENDLEEREILSRSEGRESAAVAVEVLDPEVPEDRSVLRHLLPSSAQEVNFHFDHKNTDPGEDHCSEAARDNIPEDGVYPRNLNGSERLPWHTPKRYVYTPEFEQHMMRRLAKSSYYKELQMGEALTQVRKHIARGDTDLQRRAELEIEWQFLWSEDDFCAETPVAEVTVKDAIADFEATKTAERFKRIQEQQAAEAARKAHEAAESTETSKPRSEPVTGAASPQPDSKPFEVGKGDPIPPHVKAEADRIAERVRQQQQERRRA